MDLYLCSVDHESCYIYIYIYIYIYVNYLKLFFLVTFRLPNYLIKITLNNTGHFLCYHFFILKC